MILNNSFRLWLLGVVSSIALAAVVVSSPHGQCTRMRGFPDPSLQH